MALRWICAVSVLASFAAVAAPVGACCDWTPQDEAFWVKMSENPRRFSYEMEARPSPHKLSVNGREVPVPSEAGAAQKYWHDVHHALPGEHSHKGDLSGAGARKDPRN